MLIVCRTKAPRRELTVTGSQYHRVRRVEMPVKMGCSRRSASPWLVLPGMRSAVETESAVRKCSLAVIGEVSALASRNQVSDNEICTNQGFKSFVFRLGIDSNFAYYYLKSIRGVAESLGTGTTFKEVSGSIVKSLPFILPPPDEQKVIADKLDELLAQVNNLKARLDAIPAILKRFRKSVLQAAVSGRLIGRSGVDVKELSWFVDIHNGARKPVSAKVRRGIKGDIPYYGATGVVDYLNDYTHEGRFLLVGEDGANLLSKAKDLAFFVEGKVWVNNHAHVLKEKRGVSLDYIRVIINGLDLSPWVSGSAQPKLTKNALLKLPVPDFRPEHQTEIVRHVDQLFAFADQVEQQVKNAHRENA